MTAILLLIIFDIFWGTKIDRLRDSVNWKGRDAYKSCVSMGRIRLLLRFRAKALQPDSTLLFHNGKNYGSEDRQGCQKLERINVPNGFHQRPKEKSKAVVPTVKTRCKKSRNRSSLVGWYPIHDQCIHAGIKDAISQSVHNAWENCMVRRRDSRHQKNTNSHQGIGA